ncbi:GTPase ObgE [Tepidiforma sp.]|uniref:GTPase ObgE n=1 Tax=Tepidiforma sp. TaxID=2682230 RepID=UPI002ADE339A|nr:GTPase ObgE [Tepidiforma sp.]
MLDAVEITVKGGNGGHGLVSYHREKFVPQGGPDGGDGGRGGRVFLRAVDDVYTLELYRSRRRFQAGPGANGGPNLKHGANGEDLVLEVPVGTVVHDAETGEFIADLRSVGDEVLVAHGGRGGWGNKRFATPTNQTPSFSQKGQEGEERRLRLELRLLADVGLIGLPNAGKSTLLAAVSNAKPKIASYPFTTLEPMLGVVNVGWERFTLADLPGLVEGASEGYGLGFEFLKHIRRCRVLLHLVSSESPDPVTDYELIEGELRAYDPALEEVARVVAVTKADLDPARAEASAATLAAHLGRPVRVVSAHDGTGIEPLKEELMALVTAERDRAEAAGPAEVPVLRPEPVDRFTVTVDEDGRYVVEGYTAVTFVEMTETGMPGSRDEIMRRLERWGIAKELRQLGIRPGDVMVFGSVEIPWEG